MTFITPSCAVPEISAKSGRVLGLMLPGSDCLLAGSEAENWPGPLTFDGPGPLPLKGPGPSASPPRLGWFRGSSPAAAEALEKQQQHKLLMVMR